MLELVLGVLKKQYFLVKDIFGILYLLVLI